MLPRLTPDFAWARCPACRTAQPHPVWPEPEPEPVAVTLYCPNPSCQALAFVAFEGTPKR